MQRRKLDYVDETLVPVGGVPVSGTGADNGEFLVTDLDFNSPLDPNDFPVLTRDLLFTNPVFAKYLEIEVVDPPTAALNLKLDFIGMTREKMHSRERINEPGRVVKDVLSPYR